MILDSNLALDGPAFAAITTTRDSTNTIDVGINGQIGGARDMSVGTKIDLLVLSNRAFAGGTSVQVSFQGAPDNGSGAEGTYVTYASSPVITLAQLNAAPGLILPIELPGMPYGGLALPRFYKLVYTVVGIFTLGAVISTLIRNRDQVNYYPSAINVANV